MFAEQIAKGVALLDEKVPGWLDLVDVDKLDMLWPWFPGEFNRERPGCGCLLAQIDPSGIAGRLSSALDLGHDVSDRCMTHGFAAEERDGYPPLTDEWKATILRLRAERQVVR